jgi:ATP-binding cassette subfamily B protein
MTIRHELTVGQLVAFTTYIAYLLMPLRSLGWMMSVFQRGQTSLERVLELLDATPERPEGNSPSPFRGDGVEIEAKHLTFAYPDEPEEPILHDISFTIPNGKRIGIFGRTGSGNSTLLRLFTRIYNPPPGTLFVNGVDVTTLDLHEWRDKMAVVPQTPFLFSDTIESNISVGVSSGADTKAAIKDAIVRAAFDQDLDSLTEGMDTIVGERGIMLSGGQRQRITLARALARECEFLVLDDVLSAVDHNTERRLIQTIEEMSQTPDRCGTVVLVSHRLSALASSDWILVLEEGKLVDQGTHEDLTQRPGPYREAWLHQADQAETNEGGTEA